MSIKSPSFLLRKRCPDRLYSVFTHQLFLHSLSFRLFVTATSADPDTRREPNLPYAAYYIISPVSAQGGQTKIFENIFTPFEPPFFNAPGIEKLEMLKVAEGIFRLSALVVTISGAC